jgi:hypothetical protein
MRPNPVRRAETLASEIAAASTELERLRSGSTGAALSFSTVVAVIRRGSPCIKQSGVRRDDSAAAV